LSYNPLVGMLAQTYREERVYVSPLSPTETGSI